MSVADLVALALTTKMPRRPVNKLERDRKFRANNREHLRKYKRAWRAARREKYGTTT